MQMAVPLVHDEGYVQPPETRRGRPEDIMRGKVAAQRPQEQVHVDQEDERGSQSGAVSPNQQHTRRSQSGVVSASESDLELRQQIEAMRERIRQLEAQPNLRVLESYLERLIGEEGSQPPPDYEVIAGSSEQSV
ncbi:hypothetical protein C0995_003329 [Termitomyces sp. Mi166|nr:hypothetical protein C0995_003329 [Termitomyces sp. Mi166\